MKGVFKKAFNAYIEWLIRLVGWMADKVKALNERIENGRRK